MCMWSGKAECVLPTQFWFHRGYGCTGCGREPGRRTEVLRGPRKVVSCPCSLRSLLSAVGRLVEAVQGGTGQPLLSACHLPWPPCRATRANELPSVGQVGKWSRAACTLMSLGWEVGSKQAFCRLAPVVPQGFARKGRPWPSRALYPSSAAPPAYPLWLHRGSGAAVACCRSHVGRGATRGSMAVPQPLQRTTSSC